MPQKRLKITSYHKSAAVTSSRALLSTDPNNHDAPAEGASSSSSSKTGFQIRMTSFYLIPTTELNKIVTGNCSSSSSTCSNVGEKRSHFQQQTTPTSSSTIKATRRASASSTSSTTNHHDNALSNISDTFLKRSRVNSTSDHSSRRSHSPCSSTADPNNEDDVHTSSTPLRSNTNNFRTTGGTTTTTTSIIGCEENSRSTNSDLADSTIAQVIDFNIGGKTSRSTDAELPNSTISQAIDTWEDHGMTNNRKCLVRTPYIVKDHVDGQTVVRFRHA